MDTVPLKNGIKKGLSGFIWMIEIILPISYLTAVLSWTGILEKLTAIIAPIMHLLGLPGISAIPIIVGALTSVYGGIAAMSVLPFSKEEMILMANFILICHNMIQETVIQSKSGIKAWKAVMVRVTAATVTVFLLGFFIKTGVHEGNVRDVASSVTVHQSFLEMTISWAIGTGKLCIKIFFIIMAIMIFLEVAKAKGWISIIVKATKPALKMLGLSERVGLLWMTAVVFGLAYGGAVIVEEAKNGDIPQDELEALQLSVGINHSMVEDPTLFLPLGLPPFWLWVPRLIVAMVTTRLFAFAVRLKNMKLLSEKA
ncbi:MAG: nucleoside recognition domain-containing protein [Thermodesulforhabdaceae bacterium]